MFVNFCFANVLDRNCFDQPKQSRCFNGHLDDNNRTSDGYSQSIKRSKCNKTSFQITVVVKGKNTHHLSIHLTDIFLQQTPQWNKNDKYFKLIIKIFDGDVGDISSLMIIALLCPIAFLRGPLISHYTSLRMERFFLSWILLPWTQCSCVILIVLINLVGSGSRAEERRTVNRGDGDSIPPAAVSKLSVTSYCLCLSEETLHAMVPSIWCLC